MNIAYNAIYKMEIVYNVNKIENLIYLVKCVSA